MSYVFLGLAILLEVCATTCMKLSHGLTRIVPTVLAFTFYGACFGSFMLALRKLEISVAYAIWAGLGTALVALVGMAYFKEPITPAKLVSLATIIAGIAGLHLSSKL
ncbi:MAG: multidrug efflux SMR transporter [Myxococcales bacterium]|nr:multidrug efflux SMR transporter [Myxococcales bacterium]